MLMTNLYGCPGRLMMTMGEGLNMHSIMEMLAQSRPVFYSESDFKHALSWQIQKDNPSIRIRQEVGNLIEGPSRGIRGHLAPRHGDRHRAQVPDENSGHFSQR